MNVTTCYLPVGLLAAAILLQAAPGSAQPHQIAYPEVKVVLDNLYKSDAAFDTMNGVFLNAVQRKDLAALTALVAPTFLWTVNDHPADELDLGRDAVHNFKVAFGFRTIGEDVDGGVDNGPYWEVLTAFAEEPSFYIANDAGTLVCGPMAAEVADDDAFDQARRKIGAIDDPSGMVFYPRPRDIGRHVARRYRRASRQGRDHRDAVGFYPPEKEGTPPPPPTHFEVLLPSGRTGWVPVSAVLPLETDHLCYARTPTGEWTIGSFDQSLHAP
jgi:hypothetical protein